MAENIHEGIKKLQVGTVKRGYFLKKKCKILLEGKNVAVRIVKLFSKNPSSSVALKIYTPEDFSPT